MFRTETIRVDLAFLSNQQGQADFAGIQSGIRANLGQITSASAEQFTAGFQSGIRINLSLGNVSSSSRKTQNIASISSTTTLTLSSAYFQFLTPTASSVIVKLPDVTASDYFECEIANVSAGTNALAVQEFSGTAIVTLANTGDKARSIYAYWDGATWQVWIRGYY